MPEDCVKTRIFILSDTHSGRPSRIFLPGGAFSHPFPSADVVLHTGDLSIIGSMDEYEQSMELLESLDAPTKLVIAGNHDLSLHSDYYHNNQTAKDLIYAWGKDLEHEADLPRRAHEFWTGDRAKKAGIRYLEEGIHHINLTNGAHMTVYASPWQPEFQDWAFNYPHGEDRWNPPELVEEGVIPAPTTRDPHPIPKDAVIDIVMTHGPPYKHLDLCRDGTRAGCPHLLRAMNRVRPRLHCFGHIHEAWGAERVHWNMDDRNSEVESTTVIAGLKGGNAAVTTGASDFAGPSDAEVKRNHAVLVDVSSTSTNPLKHEAETLLVNSCVVDLRYHPMYAPFLIDIDLPKGS